MCALRHLLGILDLITNALAYGIQEEILNAGSHVAVRF